MYSAVWRFIIIGKNEINAEVIQTIERIIGTDLNEKGSWFWLSVFYIWLSPSSDPLRVLERVLDLDVPVQGDGAQAQDRGRGAHHVWAADNTVSILVWLFIISAQANLIQILHAFSPRGHSPVISLIIANGITKRATWHKRTYEGWNNHSPLPKGQQWQDWPGRDWIVFEDFCLSWQQDIQEGFPEQTRGQSPPAPVLGARMWPAPSSITNKTKINFSWNKSIILLEIPPSNECEWMKQNRLHGPYRCIHISKKMNDRKESILLSPASILDPLRPYQLESFN